MEGCLEIGIRAAAWAVTKPLPIYQSARFIGGWAVWGAAGLWSTRLKTEFRDSLLGDLATGSYRTRAGGGLASLSEGYAILPRGILSRRPPGGPASMAVVILDFC